MALLQVKTENGIVEGLPAGNQSVSIFKGIPFAKPPVGDLRWKAPQPAEDWDGVLLCHQFAPIPMQARFASEGGGNTLAAQEFYVIDFPMSEDCLYLNVWTPAKSDSEKLPVAVYIHGGGMETGYSYLNAYDGEAFAKRGVIMVTIAYRLGIFGFMAHPDLAAEDPHHSTGNYAIMDQVAALAWIHRNIAAFGGDPENVTIFGQSAGKISLFTGVGYVIGSFISGGTATPNFIRFAKNRKVAVWTTVIAFFLGNTLMFCFGAIGGAFTGKEDIFYVMIAQGLAIPALIVLGANIWTTNNNALYTGGLGLANITGKPMKYLTWVAGIIGTALAIWLYYNFCGWLNVLNCALPPIGMIVILDYFKNRSKYEGKHTEAVVNWFNVLGIIAAAAVANFLHWGIAAVNAMVVSAIFFFIGELTGANK